MRVKEYDLTFIQLPKYAQTMVGDSRARMSKFSLEEEKFKEKNRDSKIARKDNRNFSHSRCSD